MYFNFLYILITLFSSTLYSAEGADLCQLSSQRVEQRFKEATTEAGLHAVVLVTRARDGMGDVAAGYLTALELEASEPGITRISIIADARELHILEILTGQDLKSSTHVKGTKIYVYLSTNINELPPADYLLHMARPSDRIGTIDIDHQRLLKPSTVQIQQTTFGNVEGGALVQYNGGLISYGNAKIEIPQAGAIDKELGVYDYPFGRQVRNMSTVEVEAEISRRMDESLRLSTQLKTLFAEERSSLRLSPIAVAYPKVSGGPSFDSSRGWKSFASYIRGFLKFPDLKKRGGILITTTRPEELYKLDKTILKQLIVLQPSDPLPEKVPARKILVLTIDPVDQALFSLLLKRSLYPPLISGDGNFSLIRSLGIPAAIQQAHMNPHLQDMREKLLQHLPNTSKGELQKIEHLLGKDNDLQYAGILTTKRIRNAWTHSMDEMPSLTQNIMQLARVIRAVEDRTMSVEEALRLELIPVAVKAEWIMDLFLRGESQEGTKAIEVVNQLPDSSDILYRLDSKISNGFNLSTSVLLDIFAAQPDLLGRDLGFFSSSQVRYVNGYKDLVIEEVTNSKNSGRKTAALRLLAGFLFDHYKGVFVLEREKLSEIVRDAVASHNKWRRCAGLNIFRSWQFGELWLSENNRDGHPLVFNDWKQLLIEAWKEAKTSDERMDVMDVLGRFLKPEQLIVYWKEIIQEPWNTRQAYGYLSCISQLPPAEASVLARSAVKRLKNEKWFNSDPYFKNEFLKLSSPKD